MVEQVAVNDKVVGSTPARGAMIKVTEQVAFFMAGLDENQQMVRWRGEYYWANEQQNNKQWTSRSRSQQ